jgi:hypothetical protein
MIVWAPWHPRHGYDLPAIFQDYAIVAVDLSAPLISLVRELNERDGTNNRTGWRAVKTNLVRAP